MTPLDNLRRIVAGWRGEWRVDAHDGVTLSHDGEEWPIASMDGDVMIALVELLNAIRPAVDGATAEIERLTAELVQAARAFGLVDRECAEAVACREEARRALLDVGIALGVDVPPLAEIEPVRANWQRYAAAAVAAAKATAAARAVPPDVEAAIKSTVDGAEEAGRCAALGHAYLITKAPCWTVPRLKDTIARAISDATASKPATVGGLLANEADALLCRWYAAKQDAIGALVDLENLRRPDPDDSWSGGIGRRDYMTGAEKRAADTKERLVDVTNKVIAAMTRGQIGEG